MRRIMHVMALVVVCTVQALLTGCPPSPETRFTLRIDRFVDDEFERALIATAESIYPHREDVLDVYDRTRAPEPPESGLWWYAQYDGVLTPYAITLDAIEYYTQLTLAWREGTDPAGLDFRRVASSFRYTARVKTLTDFQVQERVYAEVHAVWMNLEWSATCGLVCAHRFAKQRVVVFLPDGELLLVLGDGTTAVTVS